MKLNRERTVPDQPTSSVPHLTPDPAAALEQSSVAETKPRKSSWGVFAIDLRPLRDSREYRLLYISQSVSLFGTMMSFVALPWQLFRLTRSSFAVGMLGVVEFVAIFSMAFVGGALADYIDRRRLIRLTESALAMGCVILIFNSMLARPHVWILYLSAGLFAALAGLQRPALEALTPRLVRAEQMPAVAALVGLRGSIAMIGGPALGGVLVVSVGPACAYAVDLTTFIISVCALSLMQSVPPPPEADRPSFRSVMDGLRYARSRQELLGTYLVDINAMFFGMPMALFPAVAESFGGASVGLLYASPAVGALCASLTSGWSVKVQRHGLAVAIAAATWGLAIIGFGFARTLWLALVCLAVAGGADMVSGLFRMTIWNQTIPDHLRGRLAGIEIVSYTTGPMLGNAESGIIASLFSIRASIVSGGILCVVGTGLLTLMLPAFRHYDGRAGLAHKHAEEAGRAAETNAST
ncbi:MAG TPA: MFS transporter [Pyrinomonadaceae bacterium]|nr:MFS transporter [Pyrinomonadaceae bacterium]